MNRKNRPTYTPEFRHEVAQLVVDQDYSISEVFGMKKSEKARNKIKFWQTLF